MSSHTTIRNGQVLQKKPYASKKKARIARARMCNAKGLDRDRFGIYRCPVCRKYHIGSRNPG